MNARLYNRISTRSIHINLNSYQPSAPRVPKKNRTILGMIRADGLLLFVTEIVDEFLTMSA
ncbi:hypothetical protein JCM19037_4639 [Geomicrobium sp. JCM 19037]|uniref:hypothetical protein n=1 Tax=unclassified Geomicrobium TaxID=2628951 RepID=UPI00045F4B52|nr:hypothetical protein [Geomicrobium sp. JCM 19037]GAK06078.1 hypothetical protein JCM19037_4639 [Geomicrobium sp. JCM 19037]